MLGHYTDNKVKSNYNVKTIQILLSYTFIIRTNEKDSTFFISN